MENLNFVLYQIVQDTTEKVKMMTHMNVIETEALINQLVENMKNMYG